MNPAEPLPDAQHERFACEPVAAPYTVWEYHVERDYNYIEEIILTALGSQGWEMCGCHVTRETEVVCYFKRPRPTATRTPRHDQTNNS